MRAEKQKKCSQYIEYMLRTAAGQSSPLQTHYSPHCRRGYVHDSKEVVFVGDGLRSCPLQASRNWPSKCMYRGLADSVIYLGMPSTTCEISHKCGCRCTLPGDGAVPYSIRAPAATFYGISVAWWKETFLVPVQHQTSRRFLGGKR